MTEVLEGYPPAAACSADGKVIKDPDHDSVRKQSMTYVLPVALINRADRRTPSPSRPARFPPWLLVPPLLVSSLRS